MGTIQQINTDRAEWLAKRRAGIGGSDIAAILGLSKYKSPYDLWLDKTGRKTDESTGEAALWGQLAEDMIAGQFAARNGLAVQRVNSILVGREDWMLGNIDRAIVNPKIGKAVRVSGGGRLNTDQILEVKTAHQYFDKLWGATAESVPDYYLTQCQWYLGITQADVCHLAVLIGGNQYRQYKISRDDELIEMLEGEARHFWLNHVQADTAPEPTTFEDCAHKWPNAAAGSVLEADAELCALAAEYKRLAAAAKEADAEIDRVKLEIIKLTGDAETVTDGAKKLLTYKSQTTARFDSKAFKAAHPDLSELFTRTSTSRVLRIA